MGLFRKNTGGYLPAPSHRRLLLIAGGLPVLILIISAILLLSKKPATADDFLTKVRAGDAKGSYAMTSTGFRSKTSAKDWETLVGRVSKVYTGETKKATVKVKPVATDSTITELHTYELQGADGPYKIGIYLVNESGKPRVSFYDARVASRSP